MFAPKLLKFINFSSSYNR